MKLKLLFLLCLIFEIAHSQRPDEKDQFYVFDKNWKPVDVKKAVYFLRVRQLKDSDWEYMYYNMFGPRIKVENYNDQKAGNKNGKFIYYFPKGTIDSIVNYLNGEPDGEWYFMNEMGQMIRKKTYDNGILLTDSSFVPKEKKAEKYEMKPGEAESEYPGGQPGWARLLNKNLHYPDRAINSNVQGEVILQFVVDKDGSVIWPEINKSVEYSLDEEALRIISICGKWTPAIQDNKKVKSYKKQPIIFRLN